MSNRNLVGHFLNLDLLERSKPRRPSLHVQLPVRLVLRTLLRRTTGERSERFRSDFLEDFIPARIASVRVDQQERLDLGYSGDDTSNRDEFTEMRSSDCSNGQDVVGFGWSKVDVTAISSDATG